MENKQNCREKEREQRTQPLSAVFQKSGKIEYEVDSGGIVTLLLKQDHLIQRLFRMLRCRIPLYKRVKLDALGSFVFLKVDGRNDVEALGALVEAEFGDKAQPLYQRLLTFLNYLSTHCHYIAKVHG